MPRPTTREELRTASRESFRALNELVDSFSPEEKTREFPAGTLNRNVRDVLAHLHHWHLLILDGYSVGMAGGRPSLPAEGYIWTQTPELNRAIQERYRTLPLPEVRGRLAESHARVQALIEDQTDQALFEKRRYGWTGSTSLGAYLVSSTSSHYDWARKLIRRTTR